MGLGAKQTLLEKKKSSNLVAGGFPKHHCICAQLNCAILHNLMHSSFHNQTYFIHELQQENPQRSFFYFVEENLEIGGDVCTLYVSIGLQNYVMFLFLPIFGC